MWHPVTVGDENKRIEALEWLSTKGLRGTREARNDWLHPTGLLVLIRDSTLAVEFKLRWGDKEEEDNA